MHQVIQRTNLSIKAEGALHLITLLRECRWAFLFFVALATWFWWPALWNSQQIVHGDSAHLGFSLLSMLHEATRGQRSLLWESAIYGGHPLFAESQGGFTNPINLFCALLFNPEYGIGVLHWLQLLLTGFGTYLLCRVHGISHWSATFASITVGFSSTWLINQCNLSQSGAMAWLPWLFAAVEYWLNRPTLRRASLMALTAALVVTGGYPHMAYAAAIYIGCYCLSLPIKADGRALIKQHGRALLTGGAVAVLLAAGLAALQLLPLAELTTQSHRQGDLEIFFAGQVPLVSYVRGLLFVDWGNQPQITFGNLSSISACLLIGLALLRKLPARLFSHALAILLLINLGMEQTSPLFRLIYEHRLIPGLHSFRIMHPFFTVAIVGTALLAASALDRLVKYPAHLGWTMFYLAAALATFAALYDSAIPATNFVAPLIIIGALIVLTFSRQQVWLPMLVAIVVGADALLMRTHIFNFYDASVFAKPEIIDTIQNEPDIASYRIADHVSPIGLAFKPGNDPHLGNDYRQLLDSLSPLPTALWGISSINGGLALDLSRRSLINDAILLEISGSSNTSAGRRLIDLLGVKYISRGSTVTTEGFELLTENPSSGVKIYKNTLALPKVRSYSQAQSVNSAANALQNIRDNHGDHLLVEGQPEQPPECIGEAASLQPRLTWHTAYIVEVVSECPGWLFIADASYPGWSAHVNGRPAPLYPAQILGKAVQFPAGKSEVIIRFTPWSFYIGAGISLLSLLLLLIIALRRTSGEGTDQSRTPHDSPISAESTS